jgi:subtilisin family serine protease
MATFSNFSTSAVPGNPVNSQGLGIDLAAPGVDILSTLMGGSYGTGSGTSMATPHATGAFALYIAANGRATNAAGVAAIRQALINASQAQSLWGPATRMTVTVTTKALSTWEPAQVPSTLLRR